MLFETVERLTQLEVQELRREAYRHALLRRVRRPGGHRFAAWLRRLADHVEGRVMTGPWYEDFHRPDHRPQPVATPLTVVGQRHA